MMENEHGIPDAYTTALRVTLNGGLCPILVVDDEVYISTGFCADQASVELCTHPNRMVRARFAIGVARAARELLENATEE